MEKVQSGLAYIGVPEKYKPFDLLNEWIDEYKSQANPPFLSLNLATSSKNGNVTSRTILLQEITTDYFVFNTSSNSIKAQQVNENPNVAATFLFVYSTDDKRTSITRQVRINAIAEKLSQEVNERLFNFQPLFAKIRSQLIPNQGVEVNWDELKKEHDDLLENVQTRKVDLKVPSYQVTYKIVPNLMDFYYAYDNHIADRVIFKKSDKGIWTHSHVTA